MRRKYHYCLDSSKRLLRFLQAHNMSYTLTPQPSLNRELCTFDLYQDQKINRQFRLHFPFTCCIENLIEYSQSEIESADWLFVRSKSTKVEWEYEEGAFSRSCRYRRIPQMDMRYCHVEQTGPLTVVKSVKWNARQFFSGPNSADNLLFCSDQAKSLLDGRWSGLEFLPVKKPRNKGYHSNLFQLSFRETIPVEALAGGRPSKCRFCGRPLFRLFEGVNQLQVKKEFLKQGHVYKTGQVLTGQFLRCDTYSVDIVPHEFYQFCKERGMDRGLIFEPVDTI